VSLGEIYSLPRLRVNSIRSWRRLFG
jgi:hypothetical protein